MVRYFCVSLLIVCIPTLPAFSQTYSGGSPAERILGSPTAVRESVYGGSPAERISGWPTAVRESTYGSPAESISGWPTAVHESAPVRVLPAQEGCGSVVCGPNACEEVDSESTSCSHLYGGVEYLLWWQRGLRLPPLVTTSPVGTPREQAGVLGQPGTRILFGNSREDDNPLSGARFTLGYWLNCEHTVGIEAN